MLPLNPNKFWIFVDWLKIKLGSSGEYDIIEIKIAIETNITNNPNNSVIRLIKNSFVFVKKFANFIKMNQIS